LGIETSRFRYAAASESLTIDKDFSGFARVLGIELHALRLSG